MDVHYARAFVNAARRACSDILELDTLVLTPRLVECHAPHHYITGIITLSGDRDVTVSMGFDRMVAVRATEFLLGDRPSKINAQVVDAVGELTNQIAGVARQNLLPLKLQVSIPHVVCGISKSIPFPKGCQRISIPMTSIWGNLAIDFGFSVDERPSTLVQAVDSETAALPPEAKREEDATTENTEPEVGPVEDNQAEVSSEHECSEPVSAGV